MQPTEFPLAPTSGTFALWFFAIMALLMVGGIVLTAWAFMSTRNVSITVTPDEVEIHGGMYGRAIERSALKSDAARLVDLTREPALRPISRTNGIAMPHFQAGWFKLANGEKALLFVSDKTRAVYIPTTKEYSLLVSPQDAEGFLRTLQR